MEQDELIREGLRDLAKKVGPEHSILAVIGSVDETRFTCDLIDDDGVSYVDVRLSPVLDGTEALTVFPKIGTWALAVRIEGDDDWMLVSVGEADKYRIKIGSCVFEIASGTDKFSIKKGDNNLKDALLSIIQAVQKIVVMTGNNPDYMKLISATNIINDIMD